MPASAQDGTEATFRTWAPTPPRGWNSWDCYYSSVTEKQVMQNARYQHDNLLDYGWEYVVVDIRWYCDHPSLGGGWYNQKGTQGYVLDEYGRYLPSPTRFPSAMKDGVNEGFKALADSIHALGMKFGIHIMRGVPTEVAKNPGKYKLLGADNSTPELQKAAWAKVYNGTTSPCTWLADNALVRNTAEGQLYYNSIIQLYADWGVDFIKVDDISRPYYTDEITMLRKAIDQCGRPIVLSLSPGKTQLQYADNCLSLANQWRMMDDLWDNWSNVKAVFNEAHAWEKVTRPGNYADCDMLPLGQIAMTIGDAGYCNSDAGRWTNLTHDEQTTMMTLWGVCHSPLFFGGEMTRNDAFTLSLLTNRDMLNMNAYGVDAHQVTNTGSGEIVWTSVDPSDGTRYLAMFQDDDTRWVYDNLALYKSETVAYTTDGHAVNVDIPWPEGSKTMALVIDDGGDNFNYDHGDWINPTLVLRDGTEVPLTGEYMTSTYTKSYFNRIYENKNVANSGKMTVMGVTYDRGFSADANAMMLFTIPDTLDVVSFKAMAAADDSGIGQSGSTTSICFMVFNQNPRPAHSGLISRNGLKSCTMETDVTDANELKITVDSYDGSFAYDRADLVNPVLIDANGNETSLTKLAYSSYSSDWGTLHVNQNVEGGPLKVNGQTYATGLGMNAKCTLVYKLPAGHNYVKFRALCGYDSSCDTDNPSTTTGTTMEFAFEVDKQNGYDVDLTKLGYRVDQPVAVYDCWAKDTLDTVVGSIHAAIPSHGAKLYRLTPERTDGSSIALTTQSLADDNSAVDITATVSGEFDAQSYVQFVIDGKPAGSVKYDGQPVTYHAKGLSAGEHTVEANYSGTSQQLGSKAQAVTISTTTGIVSMKSDKNAVPQQGPLGIYNLQGMALSNEPERGVFIRDGRVRVK
ncbi:MAG: NPCBM/NEW2 domain-containing protein [Prevotella sp.]|nr:NPCBM/NEW2 domain-containing protein [Prevotella sp.]